MGIDEIKIIVSATSNSLSKIMLEYDNPTYIADQVKLRREDTLILIFKELKNIKDKNIIQITDFTNHQLQDAINIYSKAYNVKVNKVNSYFRNPFYLRGALELYSNKELPNEINTAEIIKCNLERKSARAGLVKIAFICLVNKINEKLFFYDSPITEIHTLGIDSDLLHKLVDNAILAETHDNNETYGIDYYYSRERDYSIAYYLRNWKAHFLSSDYNYIIQEFNLAFRTTVGKEALRWFFSDNTHIAHLKYCYDLLKNLKDTNFTELLTLAIFNQNFSLKPDKIWLERVFNDLSGIINIEEIELDKIQEYALVIYKLILANEIAYPNITQNQIYLFRKLLILEFSNEDYPFQESYSKLLLEEDNYERIYTETLIFDFEDSVIENTACLLATSSSGILFSTMKSLISNKNDFFLTKRELFIKAIEYKDADESELDNYCDMGSSWPESLEDLLNDLKEYIDMYGSIFRVFPEKEVGSYLKSTIRDLQERIVSEFKKNPDEYESLRGQASLLGIVFSKEFMEAIFEKDPLQLYLPFNEEFELLNGQIHKMAASVKFKGKG